jgi:hypothetical protein
MVTLPPRVVIALFPKVIDPWDAFNTTFKAPVLEVIVLFKIIFPPLDPVVPAFNVSVAAAPPVLLIAEANVISPFCVPAPSVLTVTLVPPDRELLIVVTLAIALFAVGVKTLGTLLLPALKPPPEVIAAEIVTFEGSNNQRPPCPLTADAITVPNA